MEVFPAVPETMEAVRGAPADRGAGARRRAGSACLAVGIDAVSR
jgi:hypothetical protein